MGCRKWKRAKVAITGRDLNKLQQAAEKIGEGTLAIQADTLHLPTLAKAYQQVKDKFGNIDVLIVNAGVFKGSPLAGYTEELFDEISDINFKGTFYRSKSIALS